MTPASLSNLSAHQAPRSVDRLLGLLTGALLTAGLIFAPWAYGTTQPWSIGVLNAKGWCLGLLWLALRSLDWRRGGSRPSPWPVRVLGWLTLAILGYELVSLLNAQAVYDPSTMSFLPRARIGWLPGTLDPAASGRLLQRDTALAGTFWATHRWLSGPDSKSARDGDGAGAPLPGMRHQWVIWALVLNGLALGAEGYWQRRSGSNKLLFRVRPAINKRVEQQFGPYAYRNNAVQYLSMIWPLGLGLWAASSRPKSPLSLPPAGRGCLLASAAAVSVFAFMTRSRTGAVVGAGAMLAAGAVLLAARWKDGWRQRLLAVGLTLAILAAGIAAGWSRISHRMRSGDYFADAGRAELRATGWRIFRENALFGTGPGTFETVYPLYRPSPDSLWYSQMHCDWLETLSTFGVAGTALVLAALAALSLRWRAAPKTSGGTAPGELIALAWLGLGSCLVHALVDFPLQVYSVVDLFVVIAALLSTWSLAPAAPLPKVR